MKRDKIRRLEKKMVGMNAVNLILATLDSQGKVVEVVANRGREDLDGKTLDELQNIAKKTGAVLIVDDIAEVASNAE